MERKVSKSVLGFFLMRSMSVQSFFKKMKSLAG